MLEGIETVVSREFYGSRNIFGRRGFFRAKRKPPVQRWSGFHGFLEMLRVRGNDFGGERHH